MPKINLLHWRAELREKRKKEFLTAVLAAVLVGGSAVYAAKLTVQGWTDGQNARNALLREEIATLDRQIEEIEGLEAQKDRLIARMTIIDRLQRSRPEVVHLFDEIVNVLPPGASFTSITQQGKRIEFAGLAESNARVGDLLRNIDSSEWLGEYQLGVIENPQANADAKFTFAAQQVTTDGSEQEETSL